MRILALDLATKMGYYNGEDDPKEIVFEKETRAMTYWAWITDQVWQDGEPAYDVVVIENALGQKGYALEVFHEFKALTHLAARLADTYMEVYSPKTIKKIYVGNGNAKKEDVIAKCLEDGVNLPYRVMKAGPDKGKKRYSDNAADAYALYQTFLKDKLND